MLATRVAPEGLPAYTATLTLICVFVFGRDQIFQIFQIFRGLVAE